MIFTPPFFFSFFSFLIKFCVLHLTNLISPVVLNCLDFRGPIDCLVGLGLDSEPGIQIQLNEVEGGQFIIDIEILFSIYNNHLFSSFFFPWRTIVVPGTYVTISIKHMVINCHKSSLITLEGFSFKISESRIMCPLTTINHHIMIMYNLEIKS